MDGGPDRSDAWMRLSSGVGGIFYIFSVITGVDTGPCFKGPVEIGKILVAEFEGNRFHGVVRGVKEVNGLFNTSRHR